jgi:hypothetical protein
MKDLQIAPIEKIHVRDFARGQLWLLAWSVMWRWYLMILGLYLVGFLVVLLITSVVAALRS